MIHLQAIASHLPDTPMMVYGIGRWAHFNVKLHFLMFESITFGKEVKIFLHGAL